MGMEFQSGNMKKVPDMDGGESCRAVSAYLVPQNCMVKMVCVIAYVFYQFSK